MNRILTSPKLFDRYRVIHYEDAEDASDFGKGVNRVMAALRKYGRVK